MGLKISKCKPNLCGGAKSCICSEQVLSLTTQDCQWGTEDRGTSPLKTACPVESKTSLTH